MSYCKKAPGHAGEIASLGCFGNSLVYSQKTWRGEGNLGASLL